MRRRKSLIDYIQSDVRAFGIAKDWISSVLLIINGSVEGRGVRCQTFFNNSFCSFFPV